MKLLMPGLLLLSIFMFSCKTPATMTQHTPADAPLAGTKWILQSLSGQPIPKTMHEAFIQFDAEKSAAYGSSGCNRMTGKYTQEGAQLQIGPMAGTRMACDEPSMKLEQALHKALADVNGYTIAGNRLELKKGDTILAVFEAAMP
jgi:heat shock protein HslJ